MNTNVNSNLNPMGELNYTMEQIHEERLKQLAQDPKNRVYTYEADTVERNMSADECRNHILAIWKYVKGRRQADPTIKTLDLRNEIQTMTNDRLTTIQANGYILVGDPEQQDESFLWKEFIATHPKIFEFTTSPLMTEEMFKQGILKLLYIKKQEECGAISNSHEAKKQVAQYLASIFARPDIDPKNTTAFMEQKTQQEKEYQQKIDAREI